ncbi:sialate O-acetylesterase [Rubritalea tangerina]|uniref:Sialate O-acetylesterase n=1 Tax=Rubritalea tangerina TaxID=430798 RepID=A0ABW4ZE75_9BACT
MDNKRISSLGIAAALTLSSATAKHIEIILLTGQSNSLGTTANKKDTDPSKPPLDPSDKHIAFFWSNRSTAAADGPAAIIGDSAGKITTLQQQQGQGRNTTFWGPEINFGRKLYASGKRDFLIIKASRGGGGNGHWVKGQQMYQHILKTTNTATEALKQSGHTFTFTTLLYLQGESDNNKEAQIAGQRFSELLANLRKDLPEATNMQAIIGGIAPVGKKHDTVREQQKQLAESRSDIQYFSNLDLQKQLYDRLHFDKAAKLEIGHRYFQAYSKK